MADATCCDFERFSTKVGAKPNATFVKMPLVMANKPWIPQEYKSLLTTAHPSLRFLCALHERNKQKKINVLATDAQISLLERFDVLLKSMTLDVTRPAKSPALNITKEIGTKRSFLTLDDVLH